MLTYKFMQVAFAVCFLLGVSLPLVGSFAVYRRLSSSGDALAHSSLAGVAIGLAAGFSPLLMSVIACVIAFLIIDFLRKKFSKFSEIGVAVVLSCSIGLAGILSSFTKANNFDAYLFGSILTITDTELIVSIVLVLLVLAFVIVFYTPIFSLLYNESEAKIDGVKVNLLSFAMDLFLSITIAIGSKVVGSLVVSSLLVLPTAIALQLKKGYKWTMILSVFFSVSSMIVGLILAYYLDLKPGATIVVVAVSLLLVLFLFKQGKSLAKRIRIKGKIE
ncbi:MAG TPA: metal ABC transporter permease [Firmicutes bacterium]|nr:metal ABC transporter permease [Bacillota bacterium]